MESDWKGKVNETAAEEGKREKQRKQKLLERSRKINKQKQ